jgi:hypothetical protein
VSATIWFDFFLTRPYQRFASTGHRDGGQPLCRGTRCDRTCRPQSPSS